MKPRILIISVLIIASWLIACSSASQKVNTVRWKHLSTVKGDLPVPNAGDQQTSRQADTCFALILILQPSQLVFSHQIIRYSQGQLGA